MATTWTIEEGTARYSWGKWQASFVPTRPTEPLLLEKQGQTDEGSWSIFAVQPPGHQLAAEEVYVRQQDLIARFRQGDADPFGFQLDYRSQVVADDLEVSLELWLSVQTNDLSSEPQLSLWCQSPRGESWRVWKHADLLEGESDLETQQLGPAALVCESKSTTGVWLIEDSDQRHAHLQSASEEGTQCVKVFGHFMEKGVIRRARMRFHLFSAPPSHAALKQAYANFNASPMPLTA